MPEITKVCKASWNFAACVICIKHSIESERAIKCSRTAGEEIGFCRWQLRASFCGRLIYSGKARRASVFWRLRGKSISVSIITGVCHLFRTAKSFWYNIFDVMFCLVFCFINYKFKTATLVYREKIKLNVRWAEKYTIYTSNDCV